MERNIHNAAERRFVNENLPDLLCFYVSMFCFFLLVAFDLDKNGLEWKAQRAHRYNQRWHGGAAPRAALRL